MNSSLTLIATGDSFINRRFPRDASFDGLRRLLSTADVRFTNLETTVHRDEGIPSARSGGTWAMAPPQVLHDLKELGFNLYSLANNHMMDFSAEGLQATIRHLDAHGLVHAGSGEHLWEANAPAYLETSRARVALIAVSTTYHEEHRAGEQRPDMIGRPGINPLRHHTVHILRKERMESLKQIAESTEINAVFNLAKKEGRILGELPEGVFLFGNEVFKEGENEGTFRSPDPHDMQRIMRSVSEASRQADVVLVSVHSHEMKGEDPERPPDFLIQFCRSCIDHGAHAVIGHGPHVVRGIEIYKNRPIFYSLGNFFFQNDTVSKLPAEFYLPLRLGADSTVADALDAKSKGNRTGFIVNRDIWESVIARWSMVEGELTELTLHPLDLGHGLPRYRMGLPKLTNHERVLERIRRLSQALGTEIRIENGLGKWMAGSAVPEER
ncbi:CapA family protein [Staphylospora marina]|uniref:CapA family protein n=1 Tax=Staphylospora marina TaxID=2490858 RepID=UPI000F5C2839|nr:CapA family protein [Staphylospora marina]